MDSLSWVLQRNAGNSADNKPLRPSTQSLQENKPFRWLPTHGAIHYTRMPPNEWRTALLRMRAGGLDTIQTYEFWILNEETQGTWRWDGQRDMGTFLGIAEEIGLGIVMRGGPWSHGECRGGGFPDWLEALSKAGQVKLRSTDPRFLALATKLYQQEE